MSEDTQVDEWREALIEGLRKDRESHKAQDMWKQGIGAIIVAITIALLGWMAVTTSESSAAIGRVDERTKDLEREVQSLRDDAPNRYTQDEADRDQAVINRRLERLERQHGF